MSGSDRGERWAGAIRRHPVAAALGVAAVGAAALRPRDAGAPHEGWFAEVNGELRRGGPGRPVLLLDVDALEANLAEVRRAVAPGLAVRVVAKSLPSVPLLALVMERLGTDRLMVFDETITALRRAFPEADLLAGKPLPVQAAAAFYEEAGRAIEGDPGRRVQWLVDGPDRLAQYAGLARGLGVKMRINLEIDVGLHRGGLAEPEDVGAMLSVIAADPAHLSFGGLMGYEPHVVAAPPLLSSRGRALAESVGRYRRFVEAVRAHDAAWMGDAPCFNGGGSKTYMLHGATGPVNEVALGSCLVKPTDFDGETLARHVPAVFIAAPVLKRMAGTKVPFLEWAGRAWSLWDPNREVTYFVFGGGWMAKPVSPRGLSDNPVFGFSTNQAMLNGSARTGLSAEDWVFFRPTQSERVMQQLGAIRLVRGGKLDGSWEALAVG